MQDATDLTADQSNDIVLALCALVHQLGGEVILSTDSLEAVIASGQGLVVEVAEDETATVLRLVDVDE